MQFERTFINANNHKKGIDVSHYQGDISWDKVAQITVPEVPIRYVYIKSTEGATVVDDKAGTYANEAKRVNITLGYLPVLLFLKIKR